MTTNNPDSLELSRRERLLTRVVDGEATDTEWAEFRSLANGELPAEAPSTWRDLAEAQRDQAMLAGAVGDRLAAAERVETPRAGLRLAGRRTMGAGRAVAMGGWLAVAAAMVLAWGNGWIGQPVAVGPGGISQASVIPAGYVRIDSPEDAVNAYLAKGRENGSVIEEVPQRVVLQARPKGACCPGVYEVVYARQFVERGEVKDLYRYGQDEAGRPTLVRASMPATQNVSRTGY